MARYEFTKAEFGEKIKMALSFDKTAQSTFGYDIAEVEPDDLFKDFADKVDPSAGRVGSPYKYLHWICETYCKKPIPAEDLYRLHNDLRDFEIWSETLQHDDQPNQINQFKNYADLQNVLRPYQQKRDARNAERVRRRLDEEQKQGIMASTTVIYEGPEGKVVMPHTAKACEYWGERTRWCIAAYNNNQFERYNKKHPIFIYLPNPSDADREAEPTYSSFKFAAVGKDIFNELDRTSSRSYPACLKNLAAAAAAQLNGAALDYFKNAGLAKRIEDMPVSIKQEEVKPKIIGSYSFFDESTHHPVYEPLMRSLSVYFEGHEKDEEEGKEALQDRPDLLADRDFILYAMQQRALWFKDLPEEYRDDPEIVKAALSEDSCIFEYVSDRLKGDRDFVFECLGIKKHIYRHISDELKADKELAKTVLRNDGMSLQYVHPAHEWFKNSLKDKFRIAATNLLSGKPDLHDDRELVKIAIQDHGMSIKYASDRLRNDRELCLSAGIFWFEYFGAKLRDDVDLVKQAVEYDGRYFEYASRRLRRNKDFIMDVVGLSTEVLRFVPSRYLRSREFMLEAVKRNGHAIQYAQHDKIFSCKPLFRDDREIVLAAVSNNGAALQYVDDQFKKDREICLTAVSSNGNAFQYISSKHQKDEEILRVAMKTDLSACKYLDRRYRPDGVFGHHGDDFWHPLKDDRDFVLEAVKANPRNLIHVGDVLKVDYELNMIAAKARVEALDYVHQLYLKDPVFLAELIESYLEQGQEEHVVGLLRHVEGLWGDLNNFCDVNGALEHLKDLPPAERPQPVFRHRPGRGGLTVFM